MIESSDLQCVGACTYLPPDIYMNHTAKLHVRNLQSTIYYGIGNDEVLSYIAAVSRVLLHPRGHNVSPNLGNSRKNSYIKHARLCPSEKRPEKQIPCSNELTIQEVMTTRLLIAFQHGRSHDPSPQIPIASFQPGVYPTIVLIPKYGCRWRDTCFVPSRLACLLYQSAVPD